MKIGIMQPYFFPYLGYWQLMNAVDKYVVYDDVNYIKGGWINRNRILSNGEVKYINLPILGASSNKKINQIQTNKEVCLIRKTLRTVEYAYKKAPYFKDVFPLIEQIMCFEGESVAEFIINSFKIINEYLDINTELMVSSKLDKDSTLQGQDKVLNICELLGASEYYNASGGQKLYSFSAFSQKGIQLKFLQTNDITYKQFDSEFENNLSIIDILMFNSKDKVKEMLNDYTLITEILD